jgi:hypothetical protein
MQHMFTGMFIPGNSSQDRNEKCTLGLTALLTIAIILLMTADMTPKADAASFPFIGADKF